MILTITSMNKKVDMYEVVNDANERMVVSSIQILGVLVKGQEFTNAYLTRKGFAVKTTNGTRYIQFNSLPRELDMAIVARLKYLKDLEESKKNMMTQALQQPVHRPTARVKAKVKVNSTGNTSMSKNNQEKIVYKGTVFLSANQLCKKFNRDVKLFKELYAKGYSIDECLGIMPLRPESELSKREDVEKMLFRMSEERGGM